MPFLKFHYKPKNELEAGGRTAALLQEDASEPGEDLPQLPQGHSLSRLWSNYNTCPCGYHFRMGQPPAPADAGGQGDVPGAVCRGGGA